jgi:hypothetical protein
MARDAARGAGARGAKNMAGEHERGRGEPFGGPPAESDLRAENARLAAELADLRAQIAAVQTGAEAQTRSRSDTRPLERAIDRADLAAVRFWAPVSDMWPRDAQPNDIPLIRAMAGKSREVTLAVAQAMPRGLLREFLVNGPLWRWVPPLAVAAREGDAELLAFFLEVAGPRIAESAEQAPGSLHGRTALIWAAEAGHVACVELLASQMSVETLNLSEDRWTARDREREGAPGHLTALAAAARDGRLDALRALMRIPGVDLGAAAPAVDQLEKGRRALSNDQPALPAAVAHDQADCVAALLENADLLERARACERDPESDWGLFQLAASMRSARAARLLVELGVASNESGWKSASACLKRVLESLAQETDSRNWMVLESFVVNAGEALDRHGLLLPECDPALQAVLDSAERRHRPADRLRAFADARALRQAIDAQAVGAASASTEPNDAAPAPSKPSPRL